MTAWQSKERRLGAAVTFLLKGRSCKERTVFEAGGKEHLNDENICPVPNLRISSATDEKGWLAPLRGKPFASGNCVHQFHPHSGSS